MTLRAATPDDAGFVTALWTRPDTARFLPGLEPEEIAQAITDERLLIWQRDDGPAGFALLMRWGPQLWSIGAMATAAPGRGDGRAMLGALLGLLFDGRGAHRVGLDATIDNTRALRLYEATGFVREGVWRQCLERAPGVWVDCAFLAMLRTEWETAKHRLAGSGQPA